MHHFTDPPNIVIYTPVHKGQLLEMTSAYTRQQRFKLLHKHTPCMHTDIIHTGVRS